MSGVEAAGLKITRVRIGLSSTMDDIQRQDAVKFKGQFVGAYPCPPDDENHYWADVIEDGQKFYYRVGDITVEIDEADRDKVIENPFLYYFSTALKLHHRIRLAKESQ